MSAMEKQTANLILMNSRNEVLFQPRDDIPMIPYPNTWCLPGGQIEGEESPADRLVREMQEEMGIGLENLIELREMEYPDETEYFFVAQMDFEVGDLKEGQAIKRRSLAKVVEIKWAPVWKTGTHLFTARQ